MDMNTAPKRRLGRGLAALIGEETSEEAVVQDARHLRHVPVELITPNPNNPRKVFRDEDVEELARSIRDKGMLQPLVVRQKAANSYEIVAGERRWRAAQRAGLHDVPVLIRDLTDAESLEVALVENIQRADLTAVEEARGYQQLIEQFGYSQTQLSETLGKSRSHITNTLRLLTLPESVRKQIEAGILTAGHARVLVASDAPEELARKIVELGMTVRQAEDMTKAGLTQALKKPPAPPPVKAADTLALEKQVSDALGLDVEIAHRGDAGGTLIVRYKTLEQLEDVTRRLQRGIGPRVTAM